tara:strand:- start:511 stop:783 length:273 start_codon:yes stop_codon:yes gene_type:complete
MKKKQPQPIKTKKSKVRNYSFGEKHTNKYLGCSFTEVLNDKKERIGWIWKHTDGKIVVMPHIGFHVWYNDGKEWTQEEGCAWLIKDRTTK